jgi:hypothetical protein
MLDEIQPGAQVRARTAFGDELPKVAVSGVTEGHDFRVVWVTTPAEWSAAQREGRQPTADPWPAEDVRINRA